MSSALHLIENRMVCPSHSPDEGGESEFVANCDHCDTEIMRDDPLPITVIRTTYPGSKVRGRWEETYCGQGCASNALYQQSDEVGRREIAKLLAAVHILCEIDPATAAPMLAEFDCDQVRIGERGNRTYVDLAQLKEIALSFRELMSPDDSVEWADSATSAAEDFVSDLGKQVLA